MTETGWWEKRWFFALVIIASAIPLLFPETPPLVDVPGHMGRFRVQLDLANSPELQRYFEFHWALVGNLGVDLLVIPLEPLFGLELAVKLIILTIPPLTAAGIFWVAKEIHGRIPPTTLFAVPFVYSYPFNFGFINFSLSLGLSLLAFAFWLRLTREGKFYLRAAIFVPISIALWITHAFGWGVLGLLTFAAELVRYHDALRSWRRAVAQAMLAVASLALPFVIMVFGQGVAVAGSTSRFFDVVFKGYSLLAVLRDRWLLWDSFAVGAALVLIGAAAFEPHLRFSRKLAIPAVLLAVVFLIMPRQVLGLSYADMRLGPLIFIITLLAIRIEDGHFTTFRRLAWLGLFFVSVRLAGTTISFAIADQDMKATLTALDRVPRGVPVLMLNGEFCFTTWPMPRLLHVGSFVIIRRHGFSNDQWLAEGAQLLRAHYPMAGKFDRAPSNLVFSESCLASMGSRPGNANPFLLTPERAFAAFPRDAFDYVWLIRIGDLSMRARPGLSPIWRTNDAVLYRVDREPAQSN